MTYSLKGKFKHLLYQDGKCFLEDVGEARALTAVFLISISLIRIDTKRYKKNKIEWNI